MENKTENLKILFRFMMSMTGEQRDWFHGLVHCGVTVPEIDSVAEVIAAHEEVRAAMEKPKRGRPVGRKSEPKANAN